MIAATAACGVGGGDDGGGGGPTGPVVGGIDDPNQANGVKCSADITLTGSYTQTTAPPTGTDTLPGCWPIGNWQFTATVAKNNGCSPAPTVLPSYTFSVALTDAADGSGQAQTPMSTTSVPAGMLTHIKISATAQGCNAIFELGSNGGKDYWNLQAQLANGSTTLTGKGVYNEYADDHWPWDDDPAN
ncbi:MAG TPA: hypothetical protein VFP84_25950 [Kofleriaceae bacterium]|nr:hypothetical protein [Kofleriaceae bacterium]